MIGFKKFFLPTLSIILATASGCQSTPQAQYATVSIPEIFNHAMEWHGKKICISGYLNFDRSNPLISHNEIKDFSKNEFIIPLGFDNSPFYLRDNSEYISNHLVRSCGTVDFAKECFDESSGLKCVPRRILLRNASVQSLPPPSGTTGMPRSATNRSILATTAVSLD